MVERQLPKLNVAGSIPVSRSTPVYWCAFGFPFEVTHKLRAPKQINLQARFPKIRFQARCCHAHAQKCA